jgi:hypothetical protein
MDRHPNDPLGIHADAAAARAKLAELDRHEEAQKALPTLQAERAAILKAKNETAAEIAKFGPSAHVESDPDRQRLVQRLHGLALALADVDARISAVPRVLAPSDKAAHVADLVRRAGAS